MESGTLGRGVLALWMIVGIGCAGGSGGSTRLASGFPEPEKLESLREKPKPESDFAQGYRDVEDWTLTGPLPGWIRTSPRRGDQAWDGLLDEFVASRAGLAIASNELECFAREVGAFVARHDAFPTGDLVNFVAGSCAVATQPPSFATARWPVSGAYDPEEALARILPELKRALEAAAMGGAIDVGLWIGLGPERIDAVYAVGQRLVHTRPVHRRPDANGNVVIEGNVLMQADGIQALATRGELSWSECEADESSALPRFRLECPVDPGDDATWITLAIEIPGRVLPRLGLQVLAHAGDAPQRFERPVLGEPVVVDDIAAAREPLLSQLNELRARALAPPLQLEADQSRVADDLVGHYFEAVLGQRNEEVAETVALGMMAGWQVDGLIQLGSFTSGWQVGSLDVSRLLASALTSPGARSALLDPDFERLAVGLALDEQAGAPTLSLLASAYQLFSEHEHHEHASRVLENLSRARETRGQRAAGTDEALRPMALTAASQVQAGSDPSDAMDALLQEAAALHRGRSVFGWVAETQDLDDIEFPDDLLTRSALDVAISVAVHKREGEAWGNYVVLVLALTPENRRL